MARPRVDDRHVLSGIIDINRNGLRWRDTPREYGPPKTLYNRWKRWSRMGVFARIMTGLAADAAEKTIMIDATYLKAHRTASSLWVKRGAWQADRANEGWDEYKTSRRGGRPIRIFVTAGSVSDDTGAAAMLSSLPGPSGCWPTGAMMPTGSERR